MKSIAQLELELDDVEESIDWAHEELHEYAEAGKDTHAIRNQIATLRMRQKDIQAELAWHYRSA